MVHVQIHHPNLNCTELATAASLHDDDVYDHNNDEGKGEWH